MSRAKHAKKSKSGCLKGFLIILLVVVLALVGLIAYFTQAPARISQRTQDTIAEATAVPGGESGETGSTETQTPSATAEPIDWSVHE